MVSTKSPSLQEMIQGGGIDGAEAEAKDRSSIFRPLSSIDPG
jgi:hypothetical protein